MISKKHLSALLTGVSLAAVGIAQASRASAATASGYTAVSTTVATPTDWLNIINFSNIGTVTNSSTIFDGFPNPLSIGVNGGALSVYVDPTSSVGEFVNDSRIMATEDATPFIGNHSTTNYATATAMLFDGIVPLVTNNGLISAQAWAHDSNFATAIAYGVKWNGNGHTHQSAKLVNNGTVKAKAKSIATFSSPAPATAVANATAVYQSRTGNNAAAGSRAKARSQNNGSIVAKSKGEAHAYSYYALARSYATGINQWLDKAETADARATNNNKILARATALATIQGGQASATYVGAVGIAQVVDADLYDGSWHDGLTAKAFARNNGTIKAFSKGKATATYGEARAFSAAAGIGQYVHGGSQLSSAFAKNTGDILVTARAKSHVYVGTYAGANAVAVGIGQFVDGADSYPLPGSVASATAKNTGNISVTAVAAADGTYVGNTEACLQKIGVCDFGAIAIASAAGISQNAYDAQKAWTAATNSGNIDVLAKATAKAHGGTYALARASAVGVTQYAAASTALADSLSKAKFTNTGGITVMSSAKTHFDVGGIAAASASAIGAFQVAVDAQTARARFKNSADGSIYVGADASARGWVAGARGFAGGAGQEVHGSYDPNGVARALSRNLGTIGVWSGSRARGSSQAWAFAGGVGLGQNVSGFDAEGTAVNTGSLTVDSAAKALVTRPPIREAAIPKFPGAAVAQATYVGGIAQGAGGPDGINGSTVQLFARNSGDIMVSGVGRAVASTYANAGAAAFGIGQFAHGNSPYAEGKNTGSIYVSSNSRAKAYGVALARSGAAGVLQGADAEFDNGSFWEDGKSAKVKFDNLGWLTVDSVAKAGYGSNQTYAQARASASGVWQNAGDAGKLRTNFSNSGWIDVSSRAVAKGGLVFASAGSWGYGASFYSYGDAAATAKFRNAASGVINSTAIAEAYGHQGAFADAFAVGAEFGGRRYAVMAVKPAFLEPTPPGLTSPSMASIRVIFRRWRKRRR